jgi:hypothetical protein
MPLQKESYDEKKTLKELAGIYLWYGREHEKWETDCN